MADHQPRTRQEIYARIRESSKDEFIREEMIRFGFWDEDVAKASDPEKKAILTKIQETQDEINKLRTELSQLESERTLSQNLKKRIKELEKERNRKVRELKKQLKQEKKEKLAESKLQRQETKERRERERKERAKAWQERREKEILYLGEEVSQGLNNKENNLERLQTQNLPIFSTAEEIAQAMEISVSELRFLTFNRSVSTVSHYIRFKMPKKTGGERLISAPKPKLKKAQYWVLNNILEKIDIHESAHGFYKKRSIVTNATPHVGAKIIINFDLKNFFPSISYKRIKGLFRSFGYSEFVATIFGLICTEAETTEVEMDGKTYYIAEGERYLPQGSPASPSLTNILCRRLDRRLQKLANDLGLEYTRYADDLTFSSAVDNPRIAKLFRNVESIVTHEGLTINESKTRILRANKKQEVTGITVNQQLNVDRKTLKNFRALLFQIERDGLKEKYWGNTPNVMAAIKGFINFVNMVNPEKAAKLNAQLKRIEQKETSPPKKEEQPITSSDSKAKTSSTEDIITPVIEPKGIILECYKKGKQLKVKVISAGYNQEWNVRFSNDLKEEGAKYLVEEIKESSRKYYTVSGKIEKLTSEEIPLQETVTSESEMPKQSDEVTVSKSETVEILEEKPTSTIDKIESTINTEEEKNISSPQVNQGIIVECYKKGKQLKVRVISEGYNKELNVRFPHNLREEGVCYSVENIEDMKGKYYVAKGNIQKLDTNLYLENEQTQANIEEPISSEIETEKIEETKQILVECYQEKNKIKTRIISAGYNPNITVYFPKNLKKEGVKYSVEEVRLTNNGSLYRTYGKIEEITDNVSQDLSFAQELEGLSSE